MKLRTYNALAAAVALGALSACGGATTPSFGGLASDAQSLFSKNGLNSVRGDNLVYSQNDTPMSGSASFTGFAGIEVVPAGGTILGLESVADVDLLGDFTMTTNFTAAGGTLSATADNFYDSGEASYDGSLAFNGEITRQAPSVGDPTGRVILDAVAGGNLTGSGAYAGVYSAADLGGTFAQGGALAIGFGGGEVTLNSGVATDGFGLAFVAERD